MLDLIETKAYLTADGLKTRLLERIIQTRNQVALVDWLSVTIKNSSFKKDVSDEYQKQTAIAYTISEKLKEILGFEIMTENKTGRNFYERSFDLGHSAGFIAIGGQSDTVNINLTGVACTFAKLGWETKLKEWLDQLDYKITRIDLAHDDFEGKYSLDYWDEQDTLLGFRFGGRPPNVEKRGNWKRKTGKGRTLYIGSAQSSKYTRIYEKGLQLGDIESPWVRTEVQYRSKDFYIDTDVLISPDKYFLASYPCFTVFDNEHIAQRFDLIDKEKLITFQRAIDITKTQFGRYIHFFRTVFGDDKLTLDILTDIKDKTIPERINILTIPNGAVQNARLNQTSND